MSEYRPEPGDRVRVLLEGKVTLVSETTGDFKVGINDWITAGAEHVISIEKIEPPVEVFKPGDVVQRKNSGARYVIGRDGYFSFQGNDFRKQSEDFLESTFTSDLFERVEL